MCLPSYMFVCDFILGYNIPVSGRAIYCKVDCIPIWLKGGFDLGSPLSIQRGKHSLMAFISFAARSKNDGKLLELCTTATAEEGVHLVPIIDSLNIRTNTHEHQAAVLAPCHIHRIPSPAGLEQFRWY